jgi:GST-like protein
MLKLYTWATPNGYKVPIMLEELGLPYEVHMVNITKGEQMEAEFLAMNPNHKIPVLVDEDAEGGPITIFESGAILLYLAEKTGKFVPSDIQGKYTAIEWLMFQMASVGPMFGQASHFIKFAPEKIEYAVKRYSDEVVRLAKVLDGRLSDVDYLAGDYSVADMATWPWVRAAVTLEVLDLPVYANLKRWFDTMDERPAVKTAIEKIDAAKPTA